MQIRRGTSQYYCLTKPYSNIIIYPSLGKVWRFINICPNLFLAKHLDIFLVSANELLCNPKASHLQQRETCWWLGPCWGRGLWFPPPAPVPWDWHKRVKDMSGDPQKSWDAAQRWRGLRRALSSLWVCFHSCNCHKWELDHDEAWAPVE